MVYTSNNQTSKGFTIVELVVVIVVIGILAAISIISYAAITNSARLQAAKTDAQTVATRLKKERATTGTFPFGANAAATQAAFDALPLKDGTASTFVYKYNSTTPAKGFCLAATMNNRYVAYVTSTNSKAVEGPCPEPW